MHTLFLMAAGLLAGMVGTAGGITSLVSYPALLFVGVGPLPASVVNTVAVTGCWPGAALTSRPELRGAARRLLSWGPVSASAGAVGSILLLSTPPGTFARLVPYLLVLGSLTLLFQPWIATRSGPRSLLGKQAPLLGGLVLVFLYNGYFGAGAGIMTLALLLLTVERHMARANALKNMLVGMAAVVSTITFAAFGRVDWTAVWPLAAGEFAGSLIGPGIARSVSPRYLRWFASAAGLAMALKLFVAP